MKPALSRRALALGLAAPLMAVVPAVAAGPSDLGKACDFALRHLAWINDPVHPVGAWPDERLDAEVAVYNAIVTRAIVEPSANLSDLAAKASLAVREHLEANSDDEGGMDDGERIVLTVLREVIRLCA